MVYSHKGRNIVKICYQSSIFSYLKGRLTALLYSSLHMHICLLMISEGGVFNLKVYLCAGVPNAMYFSFYWKKKPSSRKNVDGSQVELV